jgi:hypothetical protein
VPYHRERLYEYIEDIGNYSAELRYIDDALAYLESVRGPIGEGQSFPLDVTLGETYPFTVHIPVPQFQAEEQAATIQNGLSGLAQNASRWASANTQTLVSRIPPITDRNAKQYEFHDEKLQAVSDALKTVPSDLGLLANNLNDWKGEAAEAFADYFYEPFDNVIHNHGWLVSKIQDAVRTCQGIVNLSQNSLMDLVTATREALDEQLRDRRDQHRPTRVSTKDLLLIGTLATGLLAVATTWVPPVSATLWAASVSLGYAAAVVPEEDAEKVTVEGQSAEELSNALSDHVGQILQNSQSNYDALETKVREVADWVEERRTDRRHPLFAPRPSIVNADPDEFYHDTSSQYTG